MSLLQTTTISNQNISSALLVGTYTVDVNRSALMCDVLASQIAGNGLYTVYATRQIGGAGAAYEYQPRTTVLVESGVTSIAFPSIILSALGGDVIKVYLLGLAGDTTTPDIICEFWDMVAEIKAKTDNLPTDPADESLIEAAIGAAVSPLATSAALTTVGSNVSAIKTKTDILPADPADEALLEAAIDAVSTFITVFVAKSSEVADIPAIKAKTDQLAFTIANQVDANALTGGGSGGTGAISYTPERITDPSHNPIDGVQVWVTTDVNGVDVQASGYTNAFGYLSTPFMLDAGTYYLWRQHGGYEFTNPKTVVVSE